MAHINFLLLEVIRGESDKLVFALTDYLRRQLSFAVLEIVA